MNDFQGRSQYMFLHQLKPIFFPKTDRCASTKCREGETCILNKDGDAECACITPCEDPKDERLMVKLKIQYIHL
jgi:hypothetical protein